MQLEWVRAIAMPSPMPFTHADALLKRSYETSLTTAMMHRKEPLLTATEGKVMATNNTIIIRGML